MGFTIEDMLVISRDAYEMKLIGGQNGWSNSIKWILLVEGDTILQHFSGKEMAVTTGLGFQTEEDMIRLVTTLSRKHASALIVNTGYYINDIPESVIKKCDEEDLPLLTVPWEISISDMIKDLTLSIYQQDRADEQTSKAMITAIENPGAKDLYESDLRPYFDIDGLFQTVLISNGHLDVMDTVERRRLSYQLGIYLENITHNGNFFYYDSYFVLIMNNVSEQESEDIVKGFLKKVTRKLPDEKFYVGVSSYVKDISNLALSFQRAKSAIAMAFNRNTPLMYFDNMGINRLFYSINDENLIKELGEDLLKPLIEYDKKNDTNYVETLKLYLEYNGSVQAVSKQLFTHRNTVIYRLNNIKDMLHNDFSTPEDRLPYLIACLVYSR